MTANECALGTACLNNYNQINIYCYCFICNFLHTSQFTRTWTLHSYPLRVHKSSLSDSKKKKHKRVERKCERVRARHMFYLITMSCQRAICVCLYAVFAPFGRQLATSQQSTTSKQQKHTDRQPSNWTRVLHWVWCSLGAFNCRMRSEIIKRSRAFCFAPTKKPKKKHTTIILSNPSCWLQWQVPVKFQIQSFVWNS